MTKYLKILRNISKPHWFDIIELIKCSQGMSVGELAEALDMSYMGVKKHCIAMQKLGYLDTWRRPKEVGRPEKLYRLTERLDPLFPKVGEEVSLAILDAASQLDPNAAEKLLLSFFRGQTQRLAGQVVGNDFAERASRLAAARSELGYFSRFRDSASEQESPCIVEYHNPLEPFFQRYPTLERMEVQMFERLLEARVTRSTAKSSGLRQYRFDIA